MKTVVIPLTAFVAASGAVAVPCSDPYSEACSCAPYREGCHGDSYGQCTLKVRSDNYRPSWTCNPRSGAGFAFDGAIESPSLEINDPNGRLIDLPRPTGYSATWLPGSDARSGVYFARLRGAGGTRVVKFLVVK